MKLEEYKITTSKELTKFIKTNKCTVIKFSAKWCGPCKSEKFLGAYHELKDKYASHKNIKFIEMDIDLDEKIINDQTYYLWEVNSVPAFKLYHESKRISNHSGTSVITTIDKEIEEILTLKSVDNVNNVNNVNKETKEKRKHHRSTNQNKEENISISSSSKQD
jgi:thiol-disulfide isomerase/thioredoxin